MNCKSTADISVEYPNENIQKIKFALNGSSDIKEMTVRFGPFAPDAEPELYFNGTRVFGEKSISGDSIWVICKIKI